MVPFAAAEARGRDADVRCAAPALRLTDTAPGLRRGLRVWGAVQRAAGPRAVEDAPEARAVLRVFGAMRVGVGLAQLNGRVREQA